MYLNKIVSFLLKVNFHSSIIGLLVAWAGWEKNAGVNNIRLHVSSYADPFLYEYHCPSQTTMHNIVVMHVHMSRVKLMKRRREYLTT